MTAPDQTDQRFLLPKDFVFGAVPSVPLAEGALQPEIEEAPPPPPPLGPLASFTGTFQGRGFNTIFRPQNSASPTELPIPQPTSDNVLELNLTSETLTFSQSLGSVPNRGEVQEDIFLNGVPYLQTIKDVTHLVPGEPGIHVEPGLWMAVPSTTQPPEGPTLVRMASIPHGTTILAQGIVSPKKPGPPGIPKVSITPTANANGQQIVFPSQDATNNATARIPQDLTSFIKAGTITPALLEDPNSLLRDHIASQKIISTTTISVTTNPTNPLFGPGADNIAFLLGDPAALTNFGPPGPNAQTLSMQATFWIEEVEHTVTPPGQVATPPLKVTITRTQIQYSQVVVLNFNGLSWPHVSVATLVSTAPVIIPLPGG